MHTVTISINEPGPHLIVIQSCEYLSHLSGATADGVVLLSSFFG